MTDFVHLVGAESVERAGRQISAAAESFSSHVGYLAEVLQRDRAERDAMNECEHARRTEALDRLEQLVGRLEAAAQSLKPFQWKGGPR